MLPLLLINSFSFWQEDLNEDKNKDSRTASTFVHSNKLMKDIFTHMAFTCSKLTKKTPEQYVKYVNDIVLMSLLFYWVYSSYSGVSFVNFEQINVGLACAEACLGPYHTSLIKHIATIANGFSKYASNANC